MEDFILRKITHFDHERIPERSACARGVGRMVIFRHTYEGNERLTKAGFLTDPTIQTPIFTFSTVQGPRGSADTVRDIRGFAIKFYTQEGNFDLVEITHLSFVQDGIKFPDFCTCGKT